MADVPTIQQRLQRRQVSAGDGAYIYESRDNNGGPGYDYELDGRAIDRITELEAEVKNLEAERRAVFEWDNQSPVEHVEHMDLVGFLKTRTLRIWEHNEKMAKLEAERDELRTELEELKARLPKTVDGVAVVPGDTVWFSGKDSQLGEGPHECVVNEFYGWSSDRDDWECGDGVWCRMVAEGGVSRSLSDCYSTREAAEKVTKRDNQ